MARFRDTSIPPTPPACVRRAQAQGAAALPLILVSDLLDVAPPNEPLKGLDDASDTTFALFRGSTARPPPSSPALGSLCDAPAWVGVTDYASITPIGISYRLQPHIGRLQPPDWRRGFHPRIVCWYQRGLLAAHLPHEP